MKLKHDKYRETQQTYHLSAHLNAEINGIKKVAINSIKFSI